MYLKIALIITSIALIVSQISVCNWSITIVLQVIFFYLSHKLISRHYKDSLDVYKSLLNTMSNNSDTYVWSKDISLKYSYISDKSAKKFFKTEEISKIIGFKDSDINWGDSILNDLASDRKVLKTKKFLTYSKSGYLDSDWTELAITKYPLFNKNSSLIGIVGVCEDVTKLMRIKTQNDEIYKISKIGEWSKNVLTEEIKWSNELYLIYNLDRFDNLKPLDFYYSNGIHPKDLHIFNEYREALFKNGEASSRYRIIVSGEIKHIYVNSKSIRDDTGKIIQFFGIVQDISDIKHIEATLNENIDNYTRLLDNSPMGVLSCNLNGDLVYANKKVRQLFELDESTISTINIFSDNSVINQYVAESFRKCIASDEFVINEGYHISSLGNKLCIRLFINPVKQNNLINGSIAIIDDYTEKNIISSELLNEKNLIKNIINSIPDAIYVKDSNHNYTLLNNAKLSKLHAQNYTSILGTSDEKYYSDYESIHSKEDLVLTSGLTLDYEFEDSGEWYRVIKSPLRNNIDSEYIGLLCVEYKITKLKDSQQKLERLNKELADSNETLENFAYTTSHDLKTPLRGVNSFIDKLFKRLDELGYQNDDNKLTDYRTFIKKSISQMNSIVTDTLDYAKLNKNTLRFEMVDLKEVVLEAIRLNGSTNCEIELDIPNDLKLLMDKNQVLRLFQNLISNALKFNSKDFKKIFMSYNSMNHVIIIEDNGDGIENKYIDKIFNLFYRLYGTSVDGNGLGLAIVKRVVQLHNWRIEVDSELKKGTSFSIYI